MLENQFALTSYRWQYDVIFHSIKVTRKERKFVVFTKEGEGVAISGTWSFQTSSSSSSYFIIITIAYFLWWHLLCLSSCGRHCLLLHAGQNLQVSFYLRKLLLEPFLPSTDSKPTPPSFSDQGLLGATWALHGHYLGTTVRLIGDWLCTTLVYLGTTWLL